MLVAQVFLSAAVMPYICDEGEEEGKEESDPASFRNFD